MEMYAKKDVLNYLFVTFFWHLSIENRFSTFKCQKVSKRMLEESQINIFWYFNLSY